MMCVAGSLIMDHRYIDHAVECVAREHRWTKAEKQAFEAFARRVRDTDVQDTAADTAAQQDTGAPAQSVLVMAAQSPRTETQRERIREAYTETVLDTTVHKHIHEESLAESLAAEFGPEIAAGVLQTEPLTSELRSAVLSATEQAQTERTRMLELFEDELTSLTRASDLHEEIDTTISELDDASFETWEPENLIDAWGRLLSLEHDCEALTRRRQELLRDCSDVAEPSMDGQRVVGYLYRTASFTFPVLAATAEYVEALHDERQQITTAIGHEE